MSDLNQYAISRVLGSKMRPMKQARFGNFGLLETTAEALQAAKVQEPTSEQIKFTPEKDRLVWRAFEDVREGGSIDALLWDKDLAKAFWKRSEELGLKAPPALLNRRALNIRKNIRRYQQYGIVFSPTTRSEPHPSIVPDFAHVIEFALVRLRYRYGASIDDILIDPFLGEKFEKLALQIAPTLTDRDVRLGALYIRKTRGHFKPKDIPKAQALDLRVIERAMTRPTTLARADLNEIPSGGGLIEVKEANRYLYIGQNENIRPMIGQLSTGKAFELMANGFWTPRLESITFQFVHENVVSGVSTALWERRLIHDREPVFNWPMPKIAA